MKHLLTIFALLLVFTCCTTESDRLRMRAGLDSINQCNRNDRPFTASDVQPYVAFFDDHGTPNDRLLAHYLLGRAYHEHGEAPMALQCYHDAIDCADTTAADCDYAQLARVYGLISDILYDQLLFREQLSYLDNATKYAWKGRDTLSALIFTERKSLAYQRLNQSEYAIFNIEQIAQQYCKYGYHSNAAIALGSIVLALIEHGQYDKAADYLRIYDAESGFSIDNQPAIYCYFKGLLCLKTNRIDSAKYWFRKELKSSKDFDNQNAGAWGLANAYEYSCMNDSAAHYYKYAYIMNDSAYSLKAIQEIESMQASYNYARNQETAQKEAERADKLKNSLILTTALAIILGLVLYILLYRINLKRKDAVMNYKSSLIQIEQAHYDIIRLKSLDQNKQSLIDEKETTIRKLQMEIKKYQSQKVETNHGKIEKELKESVEYQRFVDFSRKGQIPSERDWQELHVMVFTFLPAFHQLLISKRHLLTPKEFNACFLLRLHFKPLDLCNMLEISSGHANKIRKQLLYKLFNTEGKADLFDNQIVTYF